MGITWAAMRHCHRGESIGRSPRRIVTISSVFYENGEQSHLQVSGLSLRSTHLIGRVYFVYDLRLMRFRDRCLRVNLQADDHHAYVISHSVIASSRCTLLPYPNDISKVRSAALNRDKSAIAIFCRVQPPLDRAVSVLSRSSLSSHINAVAPTQLLYRTIGILVNHFLIELQEAASRPVYLSSSSPASSNMKDTLPSADGSIGLLQFARADIDGWIRSESAPPSASTCDALFQSGSTAEPWDQECIAALRAVPRRFSSSDCHHTA